MSSVADSLDDHREDGAINMSHEDLSDVSEMDSEKRLDPNIKENTKLSMDDDVTNGSIPNVNEPDRQQDHEQDDEKKEQRATEVNNSRQHSRHSRDDDDDDDDNDTDDDDDHDNAGEIVESRKKREKSENDNDNEKEDGKEDAHPDASENDKSLEDEQEPIITDLRQKLDKKKACQQKATEKFDSEGQNECGNNKNNGNVESDLDELVKKHDEDALDFEAEEGECPEPSKEEQEKIDEDAKKADEAKKSDGEAEEGEELEEGEVSDEDEKRPEETEPKPVCRFYTRGQCTWGMSCRFLHPGVTDKGNYTMFDMVRPVSVPSGGGGGGRPPIGGGFGHDGYHDFRTDRPPLHHRAPPLLHHPAIPFVAHHDPRAIPPVIPQDVPVVESAWERGLRTAKEMMRKANKRKEQDMDFEDKKMNLTLSPDDVEKDNYYIKDRAASPEVVPQYPRHQNYQEPPGLYPPPERFARGPPPPMYDDIDPYGRSARYRELPAHRMPHYEDERRVRPAREVIVQRVEPIGRGDEWNDPWMRSKSPGGRALSDRERNDKRRRDRRSYSSNSSYSSSTSSQSDSSSESSRSPSPENRRRYNSGSHKSPPARRHFRSGGGGLRSPSPRRPRRSPSIVRSPVVKRRGHSSPSPIPEKRGAAYSPNNRKRRGSPPIKRSGNDRIKKKRRGSSTSGSGSSDSSGSGSESSSSSSESSSQSRQNTPIKRVRTNDKLANERKPAKKIETVKKRSPISIEIKKQATVGASALTSPSNSNSSEKPEVKDMKKNRREELLKQLRAVEDAIAKKRSKLT